MSSLQLSLDDIPVNLLLFRFIKNSFLCVDANNLAINDLETTKEKLLKMTLGDIFPSAKEIGFCDALAKSHREGEEKTLEVDITTQAINAKDYWHCNKIKKLNNGDFLLFFSDILKCENLKNELESMRQSEEKFRKITETSLMGIFIYKDYYIYANDAFCDMSGHSIKELKKKHPWELMEVSMQEPIKKIVTRRLKGEEFPKKHDDLVQIHPDGSKKIMRIQTQTIFYEGSYAGLGTIIDITDIQETKQKLEKIATTDNLTGISNRYYMNQVLDVKIAQFKRYKEELTLLMIDIDYFKKVNDNFGHDIGDYVLQEITKLISKQIREGDEFARWGGEEFILILQKTSKNEAITIADKLRIVISKHTFEHILSVTISIGITLFDDDDTKESLLKRVDTALYEAKDNGRNCIIFKD